MKRRLQWLWLLIPLSGCLLVFLMRRPPTVRRINTPDAALLSAISAARERLPEFDRQMQAHQPGYRFAIKGKFTSALGPEYLWVRADGVDGNFYNGRVDQTAISLPNLHKGDVVRIDRKDVVDWMIGNGADVQGGFTEKVLAK